MKHGEAGPCPRPGAEYVASTSCFSLGAVLRHQDSLIMYRPVQVSTCFKSSPVLEEPGSRPRGHVN